MDDILEKLIQERDSLREQFEPMRSRLSRLDTAIRALSNDDEDTGTRKRRKNVRGTVIEIIERAADNGITIAEILEEAESSGTPLEKTSVSTLVSTLKRSGRIAVEDGRYKAAPGDEATEAPAATKRGRKKSGEGAAAE